MYHKLNFLCAICLGLNETNMISVEHLYTRISLQHNSTSLYILLQKLKLLLQFCIDLGHIVILISTVKNVHTRTYIYIMAVSCSND